MPPAQSAAASSSSTAPGALLGHSMLVSPLAVYYKSASGAQQALQQLISAAARSVSQLPVVGGAQQQRAVASAACLQHMTTSQQQRRQQLEGTQTWVSGASKMKPTGRGSRGAAALCSTEPSSSSNGSEHFALPDRGPASRACSPAATASTKSAKRKAAEALLAAQYGGLSANNSSLAAAARGFRRAGYTSDAAAEAGAAQVASAPSSKRTKGLSAAITRLGGEPHAFVTHVVADAQQQQGQDQQERQQQQQQPPQQRHRGVGEVAGSSWQHSAAAVDADAPHDDLQLHLHSDDSAVGGDDLRGHVESAEAAGAAKQQQQQGPLRHSQQQQQQQPVVVPACGPECAHTHSHGWCHSQVKLPHVDWARVLEADMQHAPSLRLAQGYERLHMPTGIQVLVVEQASHIPAVLVQLRNSMQDHVVAIDLEWRPEVGRGFTPVAMVQLATSRMAVLIRTCRMGYRLPQPLKDFFTDPQVHLLGFSWASSDEGKMRSTFGVGQKDFGRFLDLQMVAQGLGYHGFGLARLTRQVLGISMPKNKKISMSNWETAILSRSQIKYAALDVLMAGQVFRALRLWHSSPSLCEVCHYNLGSTSEQTVFSCVECEKYFYDIRSYVQHCERAGHNAKWAECEGCGCARALPWPASATAAAGAAAGAAHPEVTGLLAEQQQQE